MMRDVGLTMLIVLAVLVPLESAVAQDLGAQRVTFAESVVDSAETTASESTQFSGRGTGPDWDVFFQPYVWIPVTIDYKATVSGASADIRLTLQEVLDDFDEVYALTGRLEAWRSGFGIIFDGLFMGIEGEFDIDIIGSPDTALDLNVEVDIAIVDFALGWRILSEPLDPTGKKDSHIVIDLIGGARYQYLKQEITLETGDVIGTSKDWVEPMIGARVGVQVRERLAVGIRADASGFGVGSASDFTYNVITGFELQAKDSIEVLLAYRWFGMDYSNGTGVDEFGFDGVIHGPYLGVTIRF